MATQLTAPATERAASLASRALTASLAFVLPLSAGFAVVWAFATTIHNKNFPWITGRALGIAGYLVTIYFIFAPSFAKAFDNWMISLLLWMSPWAGVVMADFFIKRKSQVNVAELYASPETSAYGDINWGGIIAFLAGLVAGWSVQDGLVPALQGPISGLLGGADLSWLFGIVVSGGVYLAFGGRAVAAPSLAATGAVGK